MSRVRTILLLDVAPRIAEIFRTNSKIAYFIDPVVYVEAADEGYVTHRIIERLQLIAAMSGTQSDDRHWLADESRVGAPNAAKPQPEGP
jgi:hypothetical protein